MHLHRGYDSKATCKQLEECGLLAEISEKGKPAPLTATKRWVVERTKALARWPEEEAGVVH